MYYTTKVGKLRVEKKNRSNKYINNRLELCISKCLEEDVSILKYGDC